MSASGNEEGAACDKARLQCRDGDKACDNPTLPSWARLSINRCNLPAVILGSYTYQQHPSPLVLDGVLELHRDFFSLLDAEASEAVRLQLFYDYMSVSFRLDALEDAGYSASISRKRGRLNYLKLIRGWHFNSDSVEGAVLKAWVESRFGLLPRHHRAPIRDFSGEAYRLYLEQRAAGLYNTNALEAQLDLVYTWTQYELKRRYPDMTHFALFRGLNRWEAHEMLGEHQSQSLVLLNNVNSFTFERERAEEFGDSVVRTKVPLPRIFCLARFMAERLQGEDEVLAIGGVYGVGSAR